MMWSAPATDSMLATNLADMGARLYRGTQHMHAYTLNVSYVYSEKGSVLFMKYRSICDQTCKKRSYTDIKFFNLKAM